jgi:hypothetical protein
MPADEHYFTEAEAQSKLLKRVRVKRRGGGSTAGQTGIVHETGYEPEAQGHYVVVHWENGTRATLYNKTEYEDSLEELA